MNCRPRKAVERGFTLLELMITMTVIGIVVAIGTPSLNTMIDAKRLIGATEQVYQHLQQARLEAIARSTDVHVNFSADGSETWVYGVSHRNGCDLTQVLTTGVNACVLVVDDGDGTIHEDGGTTDNGDLVLNRHADTAHTGIAMTLSNFESGSQIDFDPRRGTATSGEVLLSSTLGKQLKVKVGVLGQLRICSPNGSMTGYSTASC